MSRRRDVSGFRVLDVGGGSGVIASVLADAVGPHGDVHAVDVVDQRQLTDGYTFHQLSGTTLPFEDASFDLVVTNHVIEHVGDADAQMHHLAEVRRVLRPDGLGYLAVPNRWSPMEPHYRLPFLSWVPARLADAYVKASGRGTHYDCLLPGPMRIEQMIRAADFELERLTLEAMQVMADQESPGGLTGRLLALPSGLHAATYPVVPTLIFLLRPRD